MEGDQHGISFKVFLRDVDKILVDDPEVVRLIEKRHKKASDDYRNSREFAWLMAETIRKMRNDDSEKYVFLKDIIRELKAYDAKKPTKLYSESNFAKIMEKYKAKKAVEQKEEGSKRCRSEDRCSTSDTGSCVDEGGDSYDSRVADCDNVHSKKGHGKRDSTKAGNVGKKKDGKKLGNATDVSTEGSDSGDTYQNDKTGREGRRHHEESKVTKCSGEKSCVLTEQQGVDAVSTEGVCVKGDDTKSPSSCVTGAEESDKGVGGEGTRSASKEDVVDGDNEDKSEMGGMGDSMIHNDDLTDVVAADSAPQVIVQDMVPLRIGVDRDDGPMKDEGRQADLGAPPEKCRKGPSKNSLTDCDEVEEVDQGVVRMEAHTNVVCSDAQGKSGKQTVGAKSGAEGGVETERPKENADVALKKAGESEVCTSLEDRTILWEAEKTMEVCLSPGTSKDKQTKSVKSPPDVEIVSLEEEEEGDFQTNLDDLESIQGSDRCVSVESTTSQLIGVPGREVIRVSESPDTDENEGTFQTELDAIDVNGGPGSDHPDKSTKPSKDSHSSASPSSSSLQLVITSVMGSGSPSDTDRPMPMDVDSEEKVETSYSEFNINDSVQMDESSPAASGRVPHRESSLGPGEGSEMQADVMNVDEDSGVNLQTERTADGASASGETKGGTASDDLDSEELPDLMERPPSQTSDGASLSTASHSTGSPLVVADVISIEDEALQGSPASTTSRASMSKVNKTAALSAQSSRDSSPLSDIQRRITKKMKRVFVDSDSEPDLKRQRKDLNEVDGSSIKSECDEDQRESGEQSGKKKFDPGRLSLKSKNIISKCESADEESKLGYVECESTATGMLLGSANFATKLDSLIADVKTASSKDVDKVSDKASPSPKPDTADPKASSSEDTKPSIKERSQSPKPDTNSSKQKRSSSAKESRTSSEREVLKTDGKANEKPKRTTATFLGSGSPSQPPDPKFQGGDDVSVASDAMEEGSVDKTSISSEDSEEVGGSSRRKRQIKRLESLLKRLSEEIQNLQRRELTLEEMGAEDSVYALEDKYKKRIMKVWNKLCELQGASKTTGRVSQKKFKFEGTRYPDVNRKVERFINRQGQFPDFHDITLIVGHCNSKYKMGLPRKRIEALARDIFTQVGNTLQQRRVDDFTTDFGSHLTDKLKTYNDPALFDKGLQQKLDSNKQQGRHRLEAVINKYVEKQEEGSSSSSSSEDEEDDQGDANNSDEDKAVVEQTLLEDEETLTMETDLPLAWQEPKPEPKDDEVDKEPEAPVDEPQVVEGGVDESPAQVEEEEMEEDEEESDGSDSDLIIESEPEEDNGDGVPLTETGKPLKEEKDVEEGQLTSKVKVKVNMLQSPSILEIMARKAVHRLGICPDAEPAEGDQGAAKGSRNVAKKSMGKPAKLEAEGSQRQAMVRLGLMPSGGQGQEELEGSEVKKENAGDEARVSAEKFEKEKVVEGGTDTDTGKVTEDKVTEDKSTEDKKDTEEKKDTESQGGSGWEIDLPSPGSSVAEHAAIPLTIDVVTANISSPESIAAVPTLRAEDIPANLIINDRGSPLVQDILVIDEGQNGSPDPDVTSEPPMVYIDCDESPDSMEASGLPSRPTAGDQLPLRISSVTSLDTGSPVRPFNLSAPTATSTPKVLGSGRIVQPMAAPVVSSAAVKPQVINWPKGLESMESAQHMMQLVQRRGPSSTTTSAANTAPAPRATAPRLKVPMSSAPRMPRTSQAAMFNAMMTTARTRAPRPQQFNLGAMMGNRQLSPEQMAAISSLFGRRGNLTNMPRFPSPLSSVGTGNQSRYLRQLQKRSPGKAMNSAMMTSNKLRTFASAIRNTRRVAAPNRRSSNGSIPNAAESIVPSSGKAVELDSDTHVIVGRVAPNSPSAEVIEIDDDDPASSTEPPKQNTQRRERMQSINQELAIRKFAAAGKKQRTAEIAIQRFAVAGMRQQRPVNAAMAMLQLQARGNRGGGPRMMTPRFPRMPLPSRATTAATMPILPRLPLPSGTTTAVTMTTTSATASRRDAPLTITSYQSLATGMVVERHYKSKKSAQPQHRKEPKRTTSAKSAECIVLSDSD